MFKMCLTNTSEGEEESVILQINIIIIFSKHLAQNLDLRTAKEKQNINLHWNIHGLNSSLSFPNFWDFSNSLFLRPVSLCHNLSDMVAGFIFPKALFSLYVLGLNNGSSLSVASNPKFDLQLKALHNPKESPFPAFPLTTLPLLHSDFSPQSPLNRSSHIYLPFLLIIFPQRDYTTLKTKFLAILLSS